MAIEEPSSPPSQSPRKRPASGARDISKVIELPFALVASVAVGGGIGYFLDSRFHTSPIFTLIMGLLGFAGGMINLVRSLSKDG